MIPNQDKLRERPGKEVLEDLHDIQSLILHRHIIWLRGKFNSLDKIQLQPINYLNSTICHFG